MDAGAFVIREGPQPGDDSFPDAGNDEASMGRILAKIIERGVVELQSV
jgi:hypothetical protein